MCTIKFDAVRKIICLANAYIWLIDTHIFDLYLERRISSNTRSKYSINFFIAIFVRIVKFSIFLRLIPCIPPNRNHIVLLLTALKNVDDFKTALQTGTWLNETKKKNAHQNWNFRSFFSREKKSVESHKIFWPWIAQFNSNYKIVLKFSVLLLDK